MIILETDGQLTAAGFDVSAAGGPTLIQSGVDTNDLWGTSPRASGVFDSEL
jgi:hypothetical protein